MICLPHPSRGIAMSSMPLPMASTFVRVGQKAKRQWILQWRLMPRILQPNNERAAKEGALMQSTDKSGKWANTFAIASNGFAGSKKDTEGDSDDDSSCAAEESDNVRKQACSWCPHSQQMRTERSSKRCHKRMVQCIIVDLIEKYHIFNLHTNCSEKTSC
jgi:hypothetical protein